MKIFSRKKFVADTLFFGHHEWAKKADGKEVKNGNVVGTDFRVVDNWCVNTAPLMERFKAEKIGVTCNEDWQLDTFLKMCNEAGLVWLTGRKATEFKPCGKRNIVCGHFKWGNNRVSHDSEKRHADLGYKVIDYLDFINLEVESKNNKAVMQATKALRKIAASTQPRYKITITCEGATTTAAFEVDGKTVKTSTAKCNPVDKFNFHTGAELAFDRLFEKQHKALDLYNLKAGDKVRVRKDLEADDVMDDGTLFTYDMARFCGKVVTISENTTFGKYHIVEDGQYWFFTAEMFENI